MSNPRQMNRNSTQPQLVVSESFGSQEVNLYHSQHSCENSQPFDTPKSYDMSWLEVELYYVLISGSEEKWTYYQNKILKNDNPDVNPIVKEILSKPILEISLDDKSLLAMLAFRAELAQKNELMLCEILKVEPNLKVELQDIHNLIKNDCFYVLKSMIEKHLVISKELKHQLQFSKYHKIKYCLNFVFEDYSAKYLESGDVVDYMIRNRIPEYKIAGFIIKMNNKDDITAIRSLLYNKWEYMAEALCRNHAISWSDNLALFGLEFKCHKFLLAYIQLTNYEFTDDDITNRFFSKLFDFIKSDLHNIEIYLYLIRKYKSYIPFTFGSNLVKLLHNWLHESDLMVPFVDTNVNPVKISILILEVLKILKREQIGRAHV